MGTRTEGTPRYPEIEVKLAGEDGNAVMILGRVSVALRKAGVGPGQIEMFRAEATSGDYNHLLWVCMEWVSVK